MTKKEFKLRLKAIENKHKTDIDLGRTMCTDELEALIKEYKGSASNTNVNISQQIALVNDLNTYEERCINAFSEQISLEAKSIVAGIKAETQKVLEAKRKPHAKALKAFL